MSAVEVTNAPVPPQSLDAEESVLGACMLAPKVYFSVIETGLRATDFYRESHGRIFEAISRLSSNGVEPDAIALVDELEKTPPPDGERESKNMLEAVGGRTRIHELASLVPAASNAAHYARIVREHSTKRDLIRALHDAQRAAFEGKSFDDALEGFERKIENVRARSSARESVRTALKLAESFDEKLRNPRPEEEDGVPVPPQFGGRKNVFRRGSLYTFSGYTGDGKTVAALEMLRVACTAGHRVGYASLEMTGDELFDRLVASVGGVPYAQAQTGRVDERFRAAAESAAKTIAMWPYEVLDDEEVDPTKLRQWAQAGRYDMIVVDHLHRIEFADRFEIERTIRSIRNMAKRLDIPVVLLAQLNRSTDKKNPYPPPTLISLRETAVLEQESALVGFVYRHRDPETHDPIVTATPTHNADFIVAKSRFGKTGRSPLYFNGDRQTYTSIEGWR